MMVSRKARLQLFKTNDFGISAASMLSDSGLFQGGLADILEHPLRADPANLAFFPKDVGLDVQFQPEGCRQNC